MSSEQKGDFKLILNGVRSDALMTVAQELTILFPLDIQNALNIAKSAPIILIDKMTAQQAKNIAAFVTRLKALGADVHVTGQPVGKLQVLRWPLVPEITKRPGHHVICPNCGARLQLQVHLAEPSALAAAAQAASAPAAQHAPAAQTAPAQTGPAQAGRAPVASAGEAGGEKEVVEMAEEEVVLDEVQAAPAPSPASPPPVSAPPPASAPARAAAPSSAPNPAAGGGTGGGTGAGTGSRVMVVGKLRGEKKQNAAALMIEYLGITRDEAMDELNKRTVVTVAKDLTEEQVQQCKNRFAEIGVKVTVKA
jgi:hypothetical protein